LIKLKRMRWAGHVAGTEARGRVYWVLVLKPKGKDHLGDPGIDGRIILTLILLMWSIGWAPNNASKW
jgi:hypothetical protein